MIRKIILSAALALAAVTGLAVSTGSAEAHPVVNHPVVNHGRHQEFGRFEVQYRHRGHWDTYATFRDRDDARRTARMLRLRGFEVKVERS